MVLPLHSNSRSILIPNLGLSLPAHDSSRLSLADQFLQPLPQELKWHHLGLGARFKKDGVRHHRAEDAAGWGLSADGCQLWRPHDRE